MSSIAEKVAKAIAMADLNVTAKTHPDLPMEIMAGLLQNVVAKGHYDAMARAAIEAMREPAPEMRAAGKQVSCADDIYLTVDEVGGIWTAMVDAALVEESAT